ncbi:MAG: adenylate/guanylate cyclase domain-containing protein [Eubacterium sp.]|nr:adenylate/guanylate cyclase domain-containing protein [Eubacterium sp.]
MKKQQPTSQRSTIWRTLLAGVLAAALFAGICASNIMYAQDTYVADALYQQATPQDGQIVLINLDQKSLDALGPFASWGRALMGDVINMLNQDPEQAPAVIALDVLYVGESDDPEGDSYLAEACANSCPVVVACAGTFGSQLVENADGSFYMDDYALIAYDEPYEELKNATWQGHINSMFDADGVLRHGIWQIDLPDGEEIPSFHRQIYELYCEQTGQEAATVPVTDSDHRYYIPFQGEPGAYSDGYGVIDLLNGEIDPSAYAGKIVLIGPYAAGMQDDFATAIDHAGKMYGIEYQANMIDALIHGQTKREVGRAPQTLAVFVVTLLWALLFANRKLRTAVIGWICTVAGYIGICMAAYKNGLVLSPLYIPLSVTILFVCSIAFSYLRAALEKRRVTATFQRYVAPEIVAELLKEGSDAVGLGGKLCDIAVLFVDIRGFTTMSEVLEPEEVVQILNRYLTLTSTCIFENGGTLDKFVGDCTMAFWGAPLPQEDSIYKAVKTAFDMIERSAALEKELEEKFGRTVSFGVGVHFGPAVVGNIGAPNRMDYTAIGDTVNTAARLEANAPGGCIYVSHAVAEALAGRVRFTSLGDTVPLKGKAAGFEVLRAEELLEK